MLNKAQNSKFLNLYLLSSNIFNIEFTFLDTYEDYTQAQLKHVLNFKHGSS